MTISSVAELLTSVREHCPEAEMFRGQSEDWPLLPSIGRYRQAVGGYDNWQVLHQHLVERFIRLARPHFNPGPSSEVEWWVHAQHHGLPTRLLDWSTNPLKALFFAVNDPARDSMPGVFWSLTFHSWREDLHDEHRDTWDTELVPFLPSQLNPRLSAQEGCFLSYPLPLDTAPLRTVDNLVTDMGGDLQLTKFLVPAEAKANLRREVAAFGARYRLLFPDADGVARGIRLEELEG